MKKPPKILIAAGLLLLVVGVAILVYSWLPLGTKTGRSYIGGPGPQVTIEVPKQVRVTDSAIIRVTYLFYQVPEISPSGEIFVPDTFLDTAVGLQALEFKVVPSTNGPVLQHVKNDVPHDWMWIITPTRIGEQQVVLQFAGMSGVLLAEAAFQLGVSDIPANATIINSVTWGTDTILDRMEDLDYVLNLVVPIEVVDVLGMTAIQARIAGIGAAILGASLIMAWLYLVVKARRADVTNYDVDIHGDVQGLVIGDNPQVTQHFDHKED